MVVTWERKENMKGGLSPAQVIGWSGDGDGVHSRASSMRSVRFHSPSAHLSSTSSSPTSTRSWYSNPSPRCEVDEMASPKHLPFPPRSSYPRAPPSDRAKRTRQLPPRDDKKIRTHGGSALKTPLQESPFTGGALKISAWADSDSKKCYLLSARELVIVGVENRQHWNWIFHPTSRSTKVAALLSACRLEIRGKVNSGMLSPKTTYAALLIFKKGVDSYGLSSPIQEGYVKVRSHVYKQTVCLDPPFGYNWPRAHFLSSSCDATTKLPNLRKDGWMEIQIGEFLNDGGDDGDVEVSLQETNEGQWKRGLIVEGIELRPK